MCGIAGTLVDRPRDVTYALRNLHHRGPDAYGTLDVGPWTLAHTRLAILDLDERSNQPMERSGLALTYNGECWNHRALRDELRLLGYGFTTEGDTEVVATALAEWGPAALPRINAMFAMAWTGDASALYLARDRFGEVPLHYSTDDGIFRFASEVKALVAMGARTWLDVPPGGIVRATPDGGVTVHRWYEPPIDPLEVSLEEAAPMLRAEVEAGARERAISDVGACTLLSGGVDSSIVAAFLAREVPGLVAYTAVLDPKARDLREARLAAEVIGIPLVEVKVEVPSADDLARVVRTIEMPYKAQVEIGWACLGLAEAMQADGQKVTFSGEGSDELWASYGFAYHAFAQGADWHEYRRNLFLSQARKNFARCNKAFLSRGVECRLPFLHPGLVELALRLPRDAVADGRSRPKAVLQRAAEGLVSESVTRRAKVAFQDGMGLKAAIREVVADPRRFYAAEYRKLGAGR